MRILYVSHNPPVPLHTGGAQRTNLLLRALRDIGEVDLVIVSADEVTNEDELRRDYNLVACFTWERPGHWLPFRWFLKLNPNLVHKIAQTLTPRFLDYRPDPAIASNVRRLISEGNYDLIVGRYLRPTLKAGVLGQGVPVVLDVDDLDTQVFLNRLNVPDRPSWERAINRWHYRQIKRLIPTFLRQFDLLWVANEEEAKTVEELQGLSNKVFLPNIPYQDTRPTTDEPYDTPHAESSTSTEPVILFVGNFWVLPNQVGVDHFVRNVWPKIHAAEPRTVFRIVGSGLSEIMRLKWAAVPGVDAVGFVDDLRSTYSQCQFAVVPLLSGAGTNIKVLEALRHGRTCVLTRFAQRGYGSTLRDRQEVLVADTDVALGDACIELLRQPELRHRLAKCGRATVSEHYSFERFRKIVMSSLGDLPVSKGISEKPLSSASSAAHSRP